MMISAERQRFLYSAILEIWQMIKDFDGVEDTEQYWHDFTWRVGEIYNKHGQDDTVRRICLGYLEAKEAELRAKGEKNGKAKGN